MFVLLCPTFFGYRGSKYLENTPPTPNFAETLPRLCCPEETRFPAIKEKNEKTNKQKTT